MTERWTSETTIKFIQEVKSYECLYTTKSPLCKLKHFRDSAWKNGVESMGIEQIGVVEAKKKIRNLRYMYYQEDSKIIKSQASGASSDQVYVRTIKWFTEIDSLLNNHTERRTTINNVIDGQECKHRWEAIRGQYMKFLSSKKTRTGQAADLKARWKYGDILEFLHSFMKDKERLTSITTENPSVSTINDEDTEYDTQLTKDLDVSEDPQVSQDSEASYTLIISQNETLLQDSQSNLQVTVPQLHQQ
ncbi:hypothetical protein FQA39_LY06050 [Lamprigera yunnana]|nr:hypothetical protein FQA39_LY06050 [Lamprigera yunnana]